MSRKSKKQKSSAASLQSLRNLIINFLRSNSGRAYSLKQLTKKLGLKKEADQQLIHPAIAALVEEGKVKQLDNGSFTLQREEKAIIGVVDHVSSRFAYVHVGDDQPDVFVRTADLNTAVDGDTVKLVLLPGQHGQHPVGRVTEVVRRNRTRFVGKLERTKTSASLYQTSGKYTKTSSSIPKI